MKKAAPQLQDSSAEALPEKAVRQRRSRRMLQWIFLSALFFCGLLCAAGLGYYAWNSRVHYQLWRDAQQAMRNEDLTTAKNILEQIVAKNAEHIDALKLLAEIAERQGRYRDAANYDYQIGKLDPTNRLPLVKQGKNLLRSGNYALAAQWFCSYDKLSKLPEASQLDYVEALIFSGDFLEARRQFEKLSASQQRDPRYRLLQILTDPKLPEQRTVLDYLESLQKSQDTTLRWLSGYTLSRIAMEHQDFARARELLLSVQDLEPLRTLMPLAYLYRQSGNYQEESTCLEEVLDAQHQDLTTLVALAESYAANNRRNELVALQKKLVPNNKSGVETRYYLDAILAFLDGKDDEVQKLLKLTIDFEERWLYRLMLFQTDCHLGRYGELQFDIRKLLASGNNVPELRKKIFYVLLNTRQQLDASGAQSEQYRKEIFAMMLDIAPEGSEELHLILPQAIAQAKEQKDLIQALYYAKLLLQFEPDTLPLLWETVDLMIANNVPQQALELLQPLEESPDKLLRLAQIQEMRNNTAAAEANYQKLLQITPQDPLPGITEYTLFLLRQWKLTAARAQIARLGSNDTEQYTANQLRIALANLEKNATARQQACEGNLEILSRQAETPERWRQQAYFLALLDRDAESEQYYDKTLAQIASPDAQLLVNASEVKAALGKVQDALELARKAVAAAPQWEIAQENLKRREHDLP